MTLFGLHDDSFDDVEQVDRNDRDQVDQMVMVRWRVMAMGYCSFFVDLELEDTACKTRVMDEIDADSFSL